jgi:hypothetical protein
LKRFENGAAPQPAYGQNIYGCAPPPQQVASPFAAPAPAAAGSATSPGLAVLFELLGGTFLQTFGIGHFYAGNVGVGLGFTFGCWVLTAINFFLFLAAAPSSSRSAAGAAAASSSSASSRGRLRGSPRRSCRRSSRATPRRRKTVS